MANGTEKGRLDLPNELLGRISAPLHGADLHALALVCKKTTASANVALYKSYVNAEAPFDAPFRLFLRTICKPPSLAALVKLVDVRGWRSELEVAKGAPERGYTVLSGLSKPQMVRRSKASFAFFDRMSKTKTKDCTLFLETAMRIGLVQTTSSTAIAHLSTAGRPGEALTEDADFVCLLKHDVEDAHFVLLCALLPNLESLAVNEFSFSPTLDWYTFLSRSKGALQKLGSLKICGRLPRGEGPVFMATLQILDILPRLQFLFLSNMSVQGHRHTLEHLPSKEVRQFMFYNCAIDHRLLKKMFFGQQVKSLHYIPTRHSAQSTLPLRSPNRRSPRLLALQQLPCKC